MNKWITLVFSMFILKMLFITMFNLWKSKLNNVFIHLPELKMETNYASNKWFSYDYDEVFIWFVCTSL